MPRQKKVDSSTVSADVPPPAPPAPKPKKDEKKLSKKSTPQVADSGPAPVTPPVSEVETVGTVETTTEVQQSFTEFMAKLQQVNSLLASLKTDFRSLEKKANRELKTAQKISQRRKRKLGVRSPSGFVKPCLISNELAAFLGKDNGVEMARTEVTREINTYIRNNNLQDKANGRKINADDKLATLLNLKKDDELTYFNLQRFMSPHFQKATPAVPTAGVTPTI